MTFTLLYHVLLVGLGIGLLEGSEIAMFAVAAASKYGWRKAWTTVFAGLATLVPLLAALYLFFTALPAGITILLAGTVIFVLGAHFLYEGIKNHGSKESKKEELREEIGAGLIGVYTAIILEEAEAGGISISVGAAAGGAYSSAILGMLIGVAIPLIAIKQLEPEIERLPEWLIQMSIGTVMMAVAVLILAYHF
ncbi:MAG: hypothetical protein KGH72_04270 [Candidatus Micrarchaeota archaeon]|nr:hypothetical protein [Candidatus Micrarchaeota archaeon]